MMAEKPPRKPDAPDGWQEKFLKAYAQNGNISVSAKTARVNRRTVQRLRETDKEFAELMAEAAEEAADLLEEEARRRAVTGTDRPVYYKGTKCGSIREYSDTLLVVLLKATRPDKFRENAHIDHSGSVGLQFTEVVVELTPAVGDDQQGEGDTNAQIS